MLKKILYRFFSQGEKGPAEGYNLWAGEYDNQPGNLMLALDEEVFSSLFHELDPAGKIMADVGCGTGRHWKKILEKKPSMLTGFDVSSGMLFILKEKFPQAETRLLKDDTLPGMADDSVDILISTLTIAHIAGLEKTLQEWSRVLKPGGHMIITDYHPATLAKGGKRTFQHKGKTISLVNHVHSIEKILQLARQLGLQEERLIEKHIDDSMRPWYENKNALHVFEKFRGMPIIYGLHLKKENAVS